MNDIIDTEEFGLFSLIVFLGSFAVNIVLLMYVFFHNYVFLNIYDVAGTISIFPSGFITIMENFVNWFQILPQNIDNLWFASFVLFVVLLIRSSYFARRISNFSFVSFMNITIYFLLFAMGIGVELAQWFNNLIINEVLMGFSVLTPKYTLYIDNCLIINTVIIIICLIINRVDLDLVRDFSRKFKENALKSDLDDVDQTEEL